MDGWRAIRSGAHTLIAAPTGSGKTLAAFLAALDALVRDGLEGNLEPETRVVYVSPLKALSNDIHKNLHLPLEGIRTALVELGYPEVAVTAAVRTGDTPPAQRQALLRRPAHVLVTTPESLYLLLTSESGRKLLRPVRTVIVDEIHALAPNRRGAHLALSLERLESLVSEPLQRIGLSATQRPMVDVARFLVGAAAVQADGSPKCAVIDAGHRRELDLAIEVPRSPLEAVLSNEVWEEVYQRLAALIEEHSTTLIFVNTRRLVERVTRHLAEALGEEAVASHHGSLSAKLRHDAEARLKQGKLRALVATASLELGIDIGDVDLVCQLGSTRSISTLLQRVGRAGHHLGGVPKGRLFPLSRDELVECAAALRAVRRGQLDRLKIPAKPLDVLAQQVVAEVACDEWSVDALFDLVRKAFPYRTLERAEFDEIIQLVAHGVTTRRGRRAAYLFHDAVHGKLRARRGARLTALTSGGAIPENADYRVVEEPAGTYVGTLNEDFAIESMAGDIFQLGNTSWRILRVERGTVRVEDARGQPPNIPFWLGEAPGRSDELSQEVSHLRRDCAERLGRGGVAEVTAWLEQELGLATAAASQLAEYLEAARTALGTLPTEDEVVVERFYDELGGMQIVIHAPVGSRVLRAWGLALRKRFCRSFNFELQAAASEDNVLLSLGPEQTLDIADVPRFLPSAQATGILIQALLDAPVFQTRWRWNTNRALLVARRRGGKKVPPAIQRMEAEDMISAIFPEQLACLENIVGDREVPEHLLVRQTIDDCLHEAMDSDRFIDLLRGIESGRIRCVTRETTEPSPLAHEVLNAKPYAFLDDTPLEERRAQAVYTRRASAPASAEDRDGGQLDAEALEHVLGEVRPQAENVDEAHDALLLAGILTDADFVGADATAWDGFLSALEGQGRAFRFCPDGVGDARVRWVATERVALLRIAFPGVSFLCGQPPGMGGDVAWVRSTAQSELVRARLELCAPVTAQELAATLGLDVGAVQAALVSLEGEGLVLRGRFLPPQDDRKGHDDARLEWCDRRLLARIQRRTLQRLRAEIEPVTAVQFFRFLLTWQRVAGEERLQGLQGLAAAVELLDGCEVSAAAWEVDVLAARVDDYDPSWLDQLCLAGQVSWGRLTPPSGGAGRGSRPGPLRSSPVALFLRDHAACWRLGSPPLSGGSRRGAHRGSARTGSAEAAAATMGLSSTTLSGGALPAVGQALTVLELLEQHGASFFKDIVERSDLLSTQVEAALGELVTLGKVSSDSFAGLRALLTPQERRKVPLRTGLSSRGGRRRRSVPGVDSAGRWVRLPDEEPADRDAAIETQAWALLRRYGVVFRRVLERESRAAPWRDLVRVYRRLEARGEVRGGRFVAGFSGEQYALPEAVPLLRKSRKKLAVEETLAISAADPLNLVGILTPGERIAATRSNRILFQAGEPVAVLEGGRVRALSTDAPTLPWSEADLRRRSVPPRLRAYV